ncbi:Hypp6654 [Branchiostoma lanceolatum]|uniref:Hypp6654 protein n=1 Tax=Branchiostoma lanceolatum TaxID=7740 RepID=A0A8J9YV70_BRALA|nr:Hypp6654 [Branchiostoma lanceolatum]
MIIAHRDHIAHRDQQPVDERVAWGQWLMFTCLIVPSEHYHQYQTPSRRPFAGSQWSRRCKADPSQIFTGPSALPPPQTSPASINRPRPFSRC